MMWTGTCLRIAALTLVVSVSSTFAQSADRPNILLLMAEDMSARVGAFGDKVASTPNIDGLAAMGVRYPNTFTTAGVCAPSRAALITGMHQISFGAQHMRTETRPKGPYRTVPPPEVKAFPELLRANGYYTFNAGGKLDYQFSGPMFGTGPFTIWDEDTPRANWKSRRSNQPFFGFISFMVTHESGLHRKPGSKQYTERPWLGPVPPPARVVDPQEISVPPYYPDTETVRADIARHYNNIGSMDRSVGGVLKALEKDGLLNDTVIIWTSDHGDGLPRAKRDLYDSGIKVPMIIVWPDKWRPEGAVPGGIDTRLISFVDLAPTILALAGVEQPTYGHGRDIRAPHPRTFVYAARDRIDSVEDRQRAVRDQRFKYIRSWYPDQENGHPLPYRDRIAMVREMRSLYVAGKLNNDQSRWFEAPGPDQLYDLKTDPHEVRNLAKDPNYSSTRERLQGALNTWIDRVGDLSTDHEDVMVERFWPDGRQPKTEIPELVDNGQSIIITAKTEGASIGYRLNGGLWTLYTDALIPKRPFKLEAKAVRYGWAESPVAELNGE